MLIKVLYWLAVVVVSLALLVALVLFLEARDASNVEGGAGFPLLGVGQLPRPTLAGDRRTNRAKTTIRLAAL